MSQRPVEKNHSGLIDPSANDSSVCIQERWITGMLIALNKRDAPKETLKHNLIGMRARCKGHTNEQWS